MNKRALAIILAAWILLALAGCGGKAEEEPPPTPVENE